MSEAIKKDPKDNKSSKEWAAHIEKAPSQIREDEPTVARTIGMIGMLFLVMGGLGRFGKWVNLFGLGSRLNPITMTVMIILGVIGLLTHAAFEKDLQIRRIYWGKGLALIGLGALCALIRLFTGEEAWFAVGYLMMFGGLFFLLAVLRHETDQLITDLTLQLMLYAGGAMASVAILFGNNFNGPFLIPYGIVLSILGLMFLVSYVRFQGVDSPKGVLISKGIGFLACVALAVGVLRSVGPPLIYALGWQGTQPDFYFIPNGLTYILIGSLYLMIFLFQNSDKPLVVLTRRELSSFFFSPIIYIVLAGVVIMGWFSYIQFAGSFFGEVATVEPIVRRMFWALIFVLMVTFMVPALTMRLLSEEKRTGTLEVLMTAPVKESSVVLSKFFAAFVLFLVMWTPLILYLIAFRMIGGQPFEYQVLFCFLIALIVTGAHFIGMGVFFSSLTGNQIASAVMTFTGMLALFAFYFLQGVVERESLWLPILRHMDYVSLWQRSFQGTFLPSQLLFHLSMTIIWLFATIKIMESRRWN